MSSCTSDAVSVAIGSGAVVVTLMACIQGAESGQTPQVGSRVHREKLHVGFSLEVR